MVSKLQRYGVIKGHILDHNGLDPPFVVIVQAVGEGREADVGADSRNTALGDGDRGLDFVKKPVENTPCTSTKLSMVYTVLLLRWMETGVEDDV